MKVRVLPNHLNSEHSVQTDFFKLVHRVNHPAVDVTWAVPNQAVAILDIATRIHFSNEGVKAGVPDVECHHPSPHRSGSLFIEFKRPGKKARDSQVSRMEKLAALGHNCYVVDNARDAFNLWQEHLGISVGF